MSNIIEIDLDKYKLTADEAEDCLLKYQQLVEEYIKVSQEVTGDDTTKVYPASQVINEYKEYRKHYKNYTFLLLTKDYCEEIRKEDRTFDGFIKFFIAYRGTDEALITNILTYLEKE